VIANWIANMARIAIKTILTLVSTFSTVPANNDPVNTVRAKSKLYIFEKDRIPLMRQSAITAATTLIALSTGSKRFGSALIYRVRKACAITQASCTKALRESAC
jgi:hypothetical protein